MSSALFNRGIHTQLGVRQRAERVNKEITELRSQILTLKSGPSDTTIQSLIQRVDSLDETTNMQQRHGEKVQQLVDTQAAEITSLRTSLAETTKKLEALEGTVDELSETVSELWNRVSKVAELRNEIAKLSTVHDNLMGDNSIPARLTRLESKLSE